MKSLKNIEIKEKNQTEKINFSLLLKFKNKIQFKLGFKMDWETDNW